MGFGTAISGIHRNLGLHLPGIRGNYCMNCALWKFMKLEFFL